eukprot:5670921-Amphidinium_carterae.1
MATALLGLNILLIRRPGWTGLTARAVSIVGSLLFINNYIPAGQILCWPGWAGLGGNQWPGLAKLRTPGLMFVLATLEVGAGLR